MESVREIIALFGGMDSLRERSIRVEVEGMMPLVIEYVGEGPRSGTLVSVAHYFVQNGDLMADPDLTVEVQNSGEWLPVAYQQDGLGIYQEAVYLEGDKVMEQQSLRPSAVIASDLSEEFSYEVSIHKVRRTLHAWNDSGFDALFPQRRGPKKGRAAEQAADLRLLAEQYPDANPEELAEQLGVSRAQLYRMSRREL
jgi:hypothetical protein